MIPGKAMRVQSPQRLTPGEQHDLEKAGIDWKPGDPLPGSLPEILAQAEAEATRLDPMDCPVDPTTPPLQVNVTPLGQLKPAEQVKKLQEIARAQKELAASQAEHRAQQARLAPSVQQAVRLAGNLQVPVEDDLAESQTKPAPRMEAGSDRMTHCPNCHCQLSAAMADPSEEDQDLYLQAWLAERPFQKTYTILGGQVQVTYRALTTREIDLMHRQIFRENRRQEMSEFDLTERILRLRLCTQLLRVRSPSFDHELHPAVAPEVYPGASSYWFEGPLHLPEKEDDESAKGDTPLLAIERHVMNNVLRSENIHKALLQLCTEFNRLSGRLDILVRAPGFFLPAAAPA